MLNASDRAGSAGAADVVVAVGVAAVEVMEPGIAAVIQSVSTLSRTSRSLGVMTYPRRLQHQLVPTAWAETHQTSSRLWSPHLTVAGDIGMDSAILDRASSAHVVLCRVGSGEMSLSCGVIVLTGFAASSSSTCQFNASL